MKSAPQRRDVSVASSRRHRLVRRLETHSRSTNQPTASDTRPWVPVAAWVWTSFWSQTADRAKCVRLLELRQLKSRRRWASSCSIEWQTSQWWRRLSFGHATVAYPTRRNQTTGYTVLITVRPIRLPLDCNSTALRPLDDIRYGRKHWWSVQRQLAPCSPVA